jgi:putative acetyltransferase
LPNLFDPLKSGDRMDIIRVNTPQAIDAVRRLFREYEAYLNVDLCFQQFEAELETLPGKYSHPSGTLLLARNGEKAFGCGALRRFGSVQGNTCEMKRLYVRPEARGLGVGKQIASRLIQEAVDLGYATMLLDTLGRLEAAIHLYQALGFVRTEPYYDNPLPDAVFWKLNLREHQGT